MLNKTQTPQATEFQVYRDGAIDKTYKPKVIKKRIQAAIKAITKLAASYTAWLVINPFKAFIRELYTQIKLKTFDAIYKTNLFAQRTSGMRTQRILSAKRIYGLN